MPYKHNSELPDSVRRHLPSHAQDIYRNAFNSADKAHARRPDRELHSRRIAWAAVKRSYVKVGAHWVARTQAEAS